MKRLLSVFIVLLLSMTPVLAKGYPSKQLMNEIISFYVEDLHLRKVPTPNVVITDFCTLQNAVLKSKNACLGQFIGLMILGTKFYLAVYWPGDPGTVQLTDGYDWTNPNKRALFILAHELAHHALTINGFYMHSEHDADMLAKKFVAAYFSNKL